MWKLAPRNWAARAATNFRQAQAFPLVSGYSTSKDLNGDKIAAQSKKWQQQNPEDKAKFLSVQVDRSTLKTVGGALASNRPVDFRQEKSEENALVHLLRSMIEVKGPLTVAEFMTRALNHPDHGYYMKKDVFGSKGDFITAPEISQMFGELIAIWCVATWQQMGMPSHIKIVELGPGRGSLMSDFLRAAKSFPPFYDAIEVHMVDISPVMQKIQQETLKCEPIEVTMTPENWMQIPDSGPKIRWHTEFANVPHGPSLLIAQELFDAMPVHQFEYTKRGWCERLVDIDLENGGDHFRFVLSPGPTPATRVYIGREKLYDPSKHLSTVTETQVSGVEDLKKVKNTGVYCADLLDVAGTPIRTAEAQIGDKIEISPLSIALVQDIAKRISQSGGGALIVDYGYDHPSALSLRGIQNHKFVSVLREPGDVDLSIDVDFSTLRRFALAESKVKSSGPVGQGNFLKNMGIKLRLDMLLQNTESKKVQEDLISSYKRLVDPDQMGSVFKAMALTHIDLGQPVGFETTDNEV
ncbi:nadh dehydrogenase [Plasmopara halstedii]|uniref:Protein arginine methyltransferase NDUFAF7 n=1 Tax=Plasmopara halstedii TaxID=4781 RepID=A0A0P1B5V7_PLAHL|nr:nadh dehydrogenase [Plasmopara halstedii]CEG49218.1 nadh dehydrogenase [Plasmopara halstedii]|eukprot:XP_024585587.1 nadh dehydrogenase [Plasmopara halstedii]